MNDILSSLSIILVFITIALDIFIKEAEDFLNKMKPDHAQTTEVNKYHRVKNIIVTKLSLVTIFYLFIFYLLLPQTFKIIASSRFSLWDFDLTNTLFIIINFSLLILFLIAFVKTYKLIKY